jgi:RNA polymerase sigma-70 factor (ECF subfamily)
MPPSVKVPDDNDMVTAVQQGDETAFCQLINQNQGLVLSIVFKMVTRNEDREDLCQDIFLKVYEKLPLFGFRSKLSTWIGAIAFNTCINFLKKSKPLLLQDLLGPEEGEEEGRNEIRVETIRDQGRTPGEKMEDKDRSLLLLESIERLTVIQKTVLQLFHGKELTLHEIAEITDLPINTVKSHLIRARKHLKENMTNH